MESNIEQRQGYFLKSFDVISKLGDGAYGTVFEVKMKVAGMLEFIPVPDEFESEELERIIERSVKHMEEKYKHRVRVLCWKELLPTDVITRIWTEVKEESDPLSCLQFSDDEDSTSCSSSTQAFDSSILKCLKLSDSDNQLGSQRSDFGTKEELYLFVHMELLGGVKVEDWIEIRKNNEDFNVDFGSSSACFKFPIQPGFTNIWLQDVVTSADSIVHQQDGAYGTLFHWKYDHPWYNKSNAVKIITLPKDSAEQNEYIRECLALRKMQEGEEMSLHSIDIIEGWREHLPMDLIRSIWPEEENDEEEEEDEDSDPEFDEEGYSSEEYSSDSSSIHFATSSHYYENYCRDSQLGSLQNGAGIKPKVEYLFIRMRMCGEQTLRAWIVNNEVREANESIYIYYQMLLAVRDIHSKALIHRHLTPENIFYDNGSVVVGDFGLAIDPNLPKGSKYEYTKVVGTTTYMSPEQLEGKEYNHKVDVYALGIILFELLVSFRTGYERGSTLGNLHRGLFPDHFQSQHPREYELIKSMLSTNPNDRPEVAIVLHRFEIMWRDVLMTMRSKMTLPQGPQAAISTFEGGFAHWAEFHDAFTKAIHNNQALSSVEKLQLLKQHIKGEASKLLEHLAVTGDNYACAWELLKERYNNKRLLLSTLIDRILDQPSCSTESATATSMPMQLRQLHDTTSECLLAIKMLGCDADVWGSAFISRILARKWDKETNRVYEQGLEDPHAIRPLDDVLLFLAKRFQSLQGEFIEENSHSPP